MTIKAGYIWSALVIASIGAYLIYQNDATPPVLSDFEVSESEFDTSLSAQRFSFSGTITDDRELRQASLICYQEGKKRMIIHLGMRGASAKFASFAILPGSPSWTGSWSGTLSKLEFQGTALLPRGMKSTDCIWQANLTDAIGNENTDQLAVRMRILGN